LRDLLAGLQEGFLLLRAQRLGKPRLLLPLLELLLGVFEFPRRLTW
jgi:hypothetical protein